MLRIANDTLPHGVLCYTAFRIAFGETLERIALHDRADGDPHAEFGFLTEVPFLRGVPAHVQLDLLAETWSKHQDHDARPADLIDESVIYAACETAARVCEYDPHATVRYLSGGPTDVTLEVDPLLAEELRAFHTNLDSEGDFLLISQFEDVPPVEARELKAKFGLDPERLEPLFDVLAHWHLSPDFLGNLSGLMTGQEILRAVRVLGVR